MRHLKYKGTRRVTVKGFKKLYYVSTNQKKADVAILISGKVAFKAKRNPYLL